MTTLKRLATTIYDALVRAFAIAAPFLGAPGVHRAYGSLAYRTRVPR
jgi:hypothetical protein